MSGMPSTIGALCRGGLLFCCTCTHAAASTSCLDLSSSTPQQSAAIARPCKCHSIADQRSMKDSTQVGAAQPAAHLRLVVQVQGEGLQGGQQAGQVRPLPAPRHVHGGRLRGPELSGAPPSAHPLGRQTTGALHSSPHLVVAAVARLRGAFEGWV